jgi:hypothetical protein
MRRFNDVRAESAFPPLATFERTSQRVDSPPHAGVRKPAQDRTHAPQQIESLFDHPVSASGSKRKSGYARKLLRGPLFGRHRLPDDNAQGRPGWDDLSHRKSGAP